MYRDFNPKNNHLSKKHVPFSKYTKKEHRQKFRSTQNFSENRKMEQPMTQSSRNKKTPHFQYYFMKIY